MRTGRFILGRNDGVIYAGELLKGNEGWADGVTEDEVRNAFSLIAPEWSAGDTDKWRNFREKILVLEG